MVYYTHAFFKSETKIQRMSSTYQVTHFGETRVLDEEHTNLFTDQVNQLYVPLSMAREEIWKRWTNEDLKRQVRSYVPLVPDIFEKNPFIALFRPIASPSFECDLAVEIAHLLGLDFVFCEYTDDVFCSRNQDKVFLGKKTYFKKDAKGNIAVSKKERIIDFQKSEGKKFREIETADGGNFVEKHHELFLQKYPKANIVDMSFLKKSAGDAYTVYLYFFSFFTSYGILLENFLIHSDVGERKFTQDIILPAFQSVSNTYNFKPLISPILSYKVEDGYKVWQFYTEV